MLFIELEELIIQQATSHSAMLQTINDLIRNVIHKKNSQKQQHKKYLIVLRSQLNKYANLIL